MNTLRPILDIETEIIHTLKNIFDPEIPVNIYDLGLIYEIDVDDERNVSGNHDPYRAELSCCRFPCWKKCANRLVRLKG
jgi:hypothetical protein